MEVGSGVKNFKPGDKVVAMLSHLVSVELISAFYCYYSSFFQFSSLLLL